jgi:hypothetical protein
VAVVKFEEGGQRFSLFEGNDGRQGVAREDEVQSGVGSAMHVTILLLGRGVSFVVVTVLDAPVTSDSFCGTGFSSTDRLERKTRVWLLGV